MTARELKDKLYARHAATQLMGTRRVPGGWTVVEEWREIDVLAFSAHASPQPSVGARYPRVGYEVKVSRADYRRELLRPHKRTPAVAWCNAFYFAVPRGLLTEEELAYQEPEWESRDFMRVPCSGFSDYTNFCHKGQRRGPFIGPLERGSYRNYVQYKCETCNGKGYLQKSRVELEAPTLWVPRDVGLVVVDGRGCTVVKRSPVRREVPAVGNRELNQIVRWISARPDPRHRGLLTTELEAVSP